MSKGLGAGRGTLLVAGSVRLVVELLVAPRHTGETQFGTFHDDVRRTP